MLIFCNVHRREDMDSCLICEEESEEEKRMADHTITLNMEEYQTLSDLIQNEIEYHHTEQLDDNGYLTALEAIKTKLEAAA